MKRIKKILVPIAFSPYTEGIVDYAVMVAKSLSADQLIFMNVLNQRDLETVEVIASFGYDVSENQYIKEIQKQRTKSFEEMFEKLDFTQDKMKLVMSVGEPSVKLLEYGAANDIDLIIMGVKAKSDLIHAFTGSVAKKLFKHSSIPILSYRE